MPSRLKNIIAVLILHVSIALLLVTAAVGQKVVAHLNGEYSSAKAMKLLFGNFDSADQRSQWEKMDAPNKFPRFRDPSEGVSHLIYEAPFVQNGIPKHVVVTATKPSGQENDCHACSTLLSAAIFSKVNNVWLLTAKQMYLADLGEFGKAPSVALVTLSNSDFGLLVLEESSGSGIGQWTYIFSLDGEMAQLFMAETDAHFDMIKPCREKQWTHCSEYTGGISLVPSQASDHYDVLLVRNVTSTTSPAIHKGEHVIRFRFLNGKYIEQNR